MLTIYRQEMKNCLKSLLVWTVCVGGMGFDCILLFSGIRENMEGMAEGFASMGAFAEAFGMSRLSIATLTGFYAAEVGTIHGLGGAMFAAILGTVMLSKEEDGHTGEFLFSLPVSREGAVAAKWYALMTNIFAFNFGCVVFYLAGIGLLGGKMPLREFFIYHAMQLLMQWELAALCYALSAFMRKNKPGLGLGLVLFLYAYDLTARILPDLSDYKLISPFSYANAADILSTGKTENTAACVGAAVMLLGLGTAFWVYKRKDMAA